MIVPPVTTWPPNAFTPSRWAFESRPFVELPPPFLCAIPNSFQNPEQNPKFGAGQLDFSDVRLKPQTVIETAASNGTPSTTIDLIHSSGNAGRYPSIFL